MERKIGDIFDYKGVKLEVAQAEERYCTGCYFYKNNPEREIFQAIRIEVNNELSVIEKALPDANEMLSKGGRICVITFHSLEDRICKDIFKKNSEVNKVFKGLPVIPDEYLPKLKVISKSVPTDIELEENNRARSATLRIAEKIKE